MEDEGGGQAGEDGQEQRVEAGRAEMVWDHHVDTVDDCTLKRPVMMTTSSNDSPLDILIYKLHKVKKVREFFVLQRPRYLLQQSSTFLWWCYSSSNDNTTAINGSQQRRTELSMGRVVLLFETPRLCTFGTCGCASSPPTLTPRRPIFNLRSAEST